MIDTRMILAATWTSLMLTYLLGDVLRIFSGDFTPGKVGDVELTQSTWFGIAVLMLVPILMLLLSFFLPHGWGRWVHIAAAILLFGFNLVGLPSYQSAYDKFLIVVGLVLNVITVIIAWGWRPEVT